MGSRWLDLSYSFIPFEVPLGGRSTQQGIFRTAPPPLVQTRHPPGHGDNGDTIEPPKPERWVALDEFAVELDEALADVSEDALVLTGAARVRVVPGRVDEVVPHLHDRALAVVQVADLVKQLIAKDMLPRLTP